jgi:hypothetical protein
MTRARSAKRGERARLAAANLLREVAGSSDAAIAQLARQALAEASRQLGKSIAVTRIRARYRPQLMAAASGEDVAAHAPPAQHARDGAETMQAEKVHTHGPT